MPDIFLDLKKLLCPMPVIRLQQQIEKMQTGDVISLECTDPGALYDIPAWCRVHGHQLISSSQKDGLIFISIQVSN